MAPPDHAVRDKDKAGHKARCKVKRNGKRIVIVGAGLAGCWLARFLAEAGRPVLVIDAADAPAQGASGNAVGVVKPQLLRQPSVAETFHLRCFDFLRNELHSRGWAEAVGFHEVGVLQFTRERWTGHARARSVDSEEQRHLSGLPLPDGLHALWLPEAGFLAPARLCRQLLDHPGIETRFDVAVDVPFPSSKASGSPTDPHASLGLDADEPLVLCVGAGRRAFGIGTNGTALAPDPNSLRLGMVPARGQIDACDGETMPRTVIAGHRYLIPAGNTLWCGASFVRDDVNLASRDSERAENLTAARAWLASAEATVTEATVTETATTKTAVTEAAAADGRKDRAQHSATSRVAVRATTHDRLPLVGTLPDVDRLRESHADLRHGRPNQVFPPIPRTDNTWILGGLGSRGIVTSAWCAQQLARQLLGEIGVTAHDDSESTEVTDAQLRELLEPARLVLRQLRRGLPS
ncbi:MAG: hypothetical protein CSB44_00660 [Gammaproteobacteria bacterium]|nr:MAG: hypothetical protein CSB44_00660 [Gammaproteobacteria bacterium]